MRVRPWVQLVLRFEVNDADRARAMAEEMAVVSRQEPGTLQYDWYLDRTAQQLVLLEAYESSAALDAHIAGPVFTELVRKYPDAVRTTSVDVFGGDGMDQQDVLGADTSWWGDPIAAVTDPH